jgi:hypothetical protein
MNISESVASSTARAYETGFDPIRERQIRESAERMVERANAAGRDLSKASLRELEALAAVTFPRT